MSRIPLMAFTYFMALTHARLGDKGNMCNMVQQVTADRIREDFACVSHGELERFELPNLRALNVLLPESSDGGTVALQVYPQAKTYSSALLRMEVEARLP
jgi:hypothetical protein